MKNNENCSQEIGENEKLLKVKYVKPKILSRSEDINIEEGSLICKEDVEKILIDFESDFTRTKYTCLLNYIDSVIALTIITFGVVGFWRGSWILTDLYLNNVPFYLVLIVGTGTHAILIYTKDLCAKIAEKNKRTLAVTVFRRLHTFLFAQACVFTFNGYWHILDEIFKVSYFDDTRAKSHERPMITWGVSILSLFALTMMKSLKNTLGPPFVVGVDDRRTSFDVPTIFKSKPEKTSLYILDTVFSVYIVGTLVVFVWRGAWILMDFYLFPNDFVQSSWASLILGYGGAVISYLLQPVMKWICDRLTGGPRLIVVDIFVLFCYIFTVNTWRGIWNLLNLYFLPGNLRLSCWITLSACVILLILLKCSNSLLVRGVYIDGEEPGGNCLIFPVYYLRLIFEHEKLKKIKKIQQDYASQLKIENDTSKLSTSAVIPNNVPLNLKNKDIKEEK